jgi:phosphatidylinositol-bisphosphatase
MTPQSYEIKIDNVGSICGYRFIPKEIGQPVHPAWLSIEPLSGLILPGESVTIQVKLLVDAKCAGDLNVRKVDIQDMIIVQIPRGMDQFIVINGKFSQTCFGNSLSQLTRLPGAIRDQAEELLPDHKVLSAPRELLRLVDWLMTSGLETDRLFTDRGDPEVVEQIRECLDADKEFDINPTEHDGIDPKAILALSFGDALLQFLDSLTEPVISWGLHSSCSTVIDRDQAFEVVAALPSVNANVFVSVTAFLHFYAHSVKDEAEISKRIVLLASAFGPVLFRDDPDVPPINRLSPLAKQTFLSLFIS